MTVQDLLKLLFSTFPPSPNGEGQLQLAAYAVALEGHNERDIEAAVRKLIRGEVEGHNQSFAPSAALLGSVVRQCMNDRLDHERRERMRTPALPPPDIVHSPESQERVKRLAAQTIAKLAKSMRTEDAAQDKRMAELQAQTDHRFRPDMSDAAVHQRLMGYSIGAPESDEAAA